jgi:IPT/TIG domain-containing protein
MAHRLVARLVVVSMLSLAEMSLGCGESPYSPTPTPTPAEPTPTPAPAVMAVTSMTPSSGPTNGGDYIRINGNRFQGGATVMFDGMVTSITSLTSTVIQARTPPHSLGTVDVVVMNPDGQSVTLKGVYTYASFAVAASPSLVIAGSELTVSFEAPSGRGCPGGGDWIAIYRVGDPDETGASNGHSDLWYEHLCGATSGTFTLHAPSEPGTYEFRYMIGDTSIVRSNTVTIRAS